MEIKLNKRTLIKLKSLCTAKETINKMKRQFTGGEKRFANVTKLMQLNIIKNPIKKRNKIKAEYLNRHFSKEDIQTANVHMKRCSTLLTLEKYKSKL